ncbi:MAG: thioredoxin family protein [Phycisphaeraceae bacterium]|nr:thioredoxin family protein [Phycisphaeraceae bacterium]
MDADLLRQKFEAGQTWSDYLATGEPDQQADWQRIYDQAALTPEQTALLEGFVRQFHVLVLSGIWCGDCVQQVPLIQRIAEAGGDRIAVRYLDRDAHEALQAEVSINGGHRVPVVIFAAEDFEPVGWFGDRTLNRYRALAQRQLGASCPLPGAPVDDDELAVTLSDWVDQFERVHLLLRLSGRLREKHGD